MMMALSDDVGASVDDVQLSLNLDGRDQQVETTRLNSRTLKFTAPSKPTDLTEQMLVICVFDYVYAVLCILQ